MSNEIPQNSGISRTNNAYPLDQFKTSPTAGESFCWRLYHQRGKIHSSLEFDTSKKRHLQRGLNEHKTLFRSALYILWGVALVWGVAFANNTVYPVISTQFPHVHTTVNDIFSDAVYHFVAFMPVIWAPKFFGYQLGTISKHWKILLGMIVFFVSAPLLYRLVLGETPFGANTWFFEGIVVPFAEEGFFRGILLSMLLWGFGKQYKATTADWLTNIFSTLIFSTAHLNNLGHYPTGFILFQVGFSTILGLCFGYNRIMTGSIYPPILAHALFNLAGTL